MKSRGFALTLIVSLVVVVIAAAWSQGDVSPTSPCARSPAIACMRTPALERLGRHVATHGGVRGTCKGCATPYMQLISLELVMRAFPRGSKAWAVCIVERESGANPGAISSTHDYSLGQLHAGLWPVDLQRTLRDPGYAARAFALVAEHGARRWPWDGGAYAC